MAFSRLRQAKQQGAEDLNLIPVMNLFMVLIPFLLMGAAFYHISVIPTSVPVNDPQQSDVPKTPTTVAVNLEVKQEMLRLTVASVSLDAEELDALGAQWPRDSKEGYPVMALQQHLKDLKKQYPKSNTLTLLPHDDLEYQELVHILDHAREWNTGKNNDKGEPIFEELFPVTIFSRLLLLPESGGEEGAVEDGESLEFGEEGEEGGDGDGE